MSSNISPSEKLEKPFRISWHAQLKTKSHTYDSVVAEAQREDRSVSYIASRALEKYYEEKAKLNVI